MSVDLIGALLDRGLLPDAAIRLGIRRLLAVRLRSERRRTAATVASLGEQPVALAPEAANRQLTRCRRSSSPRCSVHA